MFHSAQFLERSLRFAEYSSLAYLSDVQQVDEFLS